MLLVGPSALAFLPAITLGAFWLGGEQALILAAAALPTLYLLAGGYSGLTQQGASARTTSTGLVQRDTFDEVVEQTHARVRESGLISATMMLELNEQTQLVDRYGQSAMDMIVQRTSERIAGVLRQGDHVALLGDVRFGMCLAPVRQLDLELCIQLCGRLQAAVEEPVSIDGTAVYVTATIGFCQHSRSPKATGQAWLQAASTALREAQRRGPTAIRAFSVEMRRMTESRAELREEVVTGLELGHIQPWFQPQISTDTGLVTGFEALARWQHPKRGMIPPGEFMPAMEQAGMMERLAEVMLYHAFTALKAWDSAGHHVPQVGVNFAGSELKNPRLVEKIRWELDRFELSADRLAIEVLETVVASAPDDVVTRNIKGLCDLGCRIDLDDFGTGHASIASIRRFSVNRIKIDKSFVMKADRDPEQQRMISAILTMAERLNVETLAEGVESVGEHALLAQLGCDHVQGFGIARPMPFEQTLDWISAHNDKLRDPPKITGHHVK